MDIPVDVTNDGKENQYLDRENIRVIDFDQEYDLDLTGQSPKEIIQRIYRSVPDPLRRKFEKDRTPINYYNKNVNNNLFTLRQQIVEKLKDRGETSKIDRRCNNCEAKQLRHIKALSPCNKDKLNEQNLEVKFDEIQLDDPPIFHDEIRSKNFKELDKSLDISNKISNDFERTKFHSDSSSHISHAQLDASCVIKVIKDDLILPSDWGLNKRQLCDLEMLLNKSFYPLEGYLCSKDYESVLKNMTLSDGKSLWPIPIVFPLPCDNVGYSNVHWIRSKNTNMNDNLFSKKMIKLRDGLGVVVAELQVEEIYLPNIEKEIFYVVGSSDPNHPYAKYLRESQSNCYYIGGKVKLVNKIQNFNNLSYRLSPYEVRSMIRKNRWSTENGLDDEEFKVSLSYSNDEIDEAFILNSLTESNCENMSLNDLDLESSGNDKLHPVNQNSENDKETVQTNVIGFQTRNPMHRCHYELTLEAIRSIRAMDERTYGKGNTRKNVLFLMPAVGVTQDDDIDPRIRIKCYKKILKYYRNVCDVYLILLPLFMRMAGPREAVWHAIIRRNYGCTHFIVGRDHAGPSVKKVDGSDFYDTYAAQNILRKLKDHIGIEPVFGKEMCYVVDRYCQEKVGRYIPCNEVDEDKHILHKLSGTQLRELIRNRKDVPNWYSFKEILAELTNSMVSRHEMGFCVYFTGLPSSGKSTLASILREFILETEDKRRITMLDADAIRAHLSSGLGFDRIDRSINVRRIGYVASEIVKHRGICIVANIAPYEADRLYNKKLIESSGGGYIEVYVSTPLEVCEKRDNKGLYRKARNGTIKQFTGISDPYEVPKNCHLNLNSSQFMMKTAFKVFEYLKNNEWL